MTKVVIGPFVIDNTKSREEIIQQVTDAIESVAKSQFEERPKANPIEYSRKAAGVAETSEHEARRMRREQAEAVQKQAERDQVVWEWADNEFTTEEVEKLVKLKRLIPGAFDKVIWMAETMVRKRNDYGASNLKAAASVGIPNWKGVLLRAMDKYARIIHFAAGGDFQVVSETFDETALDLANYMILMAVLYEEEKSE